MMRHGTVVENQMGQSMVVNWFDNQKAMCTFHHKDGFDCAWFLRSELTVKRY